MNPTTSDRVVLDVTTFKALASESRIRLLKALDERPKTVSELGRELEMSKAAVHEHLNVLVDCELVARGDDGERVWVYYRLTWKGTGIVNPLKRRVAFFLALSTTFFFTGYVYLLVLVKGLKDTTRGFTDAIARDAGGIGLQAVQATPTATLWDVAGAAALLGTAGVLLAVAVTEMRRARRRAADGGGDE